jgi:hypothetical protein
MQHAITAPRRQVCDRQSNYDKRGHHTPADTSTDSLNENNDEGSRHERQSEDVSPVETPGLAGGIKTPGVETEGQSHEDHPYHEVPPDATPDDIHQTARGMK